MTPEQRQARKQDKFLGHLEETANVSDSARLAKISRSMVYRWRRDSLEDPENNDLAIRWDEALERGIGALEDEAMRRALHGVSEPVVYQGKISTITDEAGKLRTVTVQRYSDALTIFLLKCRKPEVYRDRQELAGAGGGPLVVTVKKFGE